MAARTSEHDYAVTAESAHALLRSLGEAEQCPAVADPGVPGYIVDRLVGEGGGGRVYRAYREGSTRPVALKVMRRGGEQETARANREMEMLESLRLMCVPRITDYGVHEGCLFMAAEFVDGLPLDEHCAGLPGGP